MVTRGSLLLRREQRGSLLKAKEGKDFGGGARYATIRTHVGHVVDKGVDKLRALASGGHGRSEADVACGAGRGLLRGGGRCAG